MDEVFYEIYITFFMHKYVFFYVFLGIKKPRIGGSFNTDYILSKWSAISSNVYA